MSGGLPAWTPTVAHTRAVVVGGIGLLAALVLRRPDLLVLVTPFLLVAVWARVTRPDIGPEVTTRLGRPTVAEGEPVAWELRLQLPAGAEDAVVGLPHSLFLEDDLGVGCRAYAVEEIASRTLRSVVTLRPTRWGERSIATEAVLVLGPWAAYRCGPEPLPAEQLIVVPAATHVDPQGPLPHPEGLVGVNRAARPGSGGEFASLRPFQPGDRLRRVRWPISLRTGTLHVATTYADQDAAVVLLVDAFSDLGPREGVDGRPTSLDLTVRAAGALSHHYLACGDRVGLRAVGSEGTPALRAHSGRRQLRRILDTLARLEPATARNDDGERAGLGVPAGSLVIVLSPLVDPAMVAVVARLGARGLTTFVVDTMPEHLWNEVEDPAAAVAWRLRRTTRSAQLSRLADLGIPTVPWTGPGSLDTVLRDLSRRSRAPRAVVR